MSLLRDACACLAPAAVPRLPRSCLTHQANFSSPLSFPAVAWPRHLLPRRCRRPHQANLSSPISSPAVAWPRRSPPDLLPRRCLHAGPPPRQAFPLHIFQYFNSSYFQDMPNQHVLNKYVDEVLEYLQSRATEPPKLICGCGQPATCSTVSSPPNQKNKRFYCKTCNMRIWEDTLKKFVDDMLFYCQAATIDSLTSELQNSNRVLLHKDKQIAAMEAELMKVKDDAELMKVNDEEHWKSAPSAVVEEQKTVGQRRSCFCNVCIFVMVSAIILKLIL